MALIGPRPQPLIDPEEQERKRRAVEVVQQRSLFGPRPQSPIDPNANPVRQAVSQQISNDFRMPTALVNPNAGQPSAVAPATTAGRIGPRPQPSLINPDEPIIPSVRDSVQRQVSNGFQFQAQPPVDPGVTKSSSGIGPRQTVPLGQLVNPEASQTRNDVIAASPAVNNRRLCSHRQRPCAIKQSANLVHRNDAMFLVCLGMG